MAGNITITKVHFPNPVTSNQHLYVEYKLATQPASSYVVFSSDMEVDTFGVPVASPLPEITGLTSGLLYNVKFSNLCESPVGLDYWVENITVL